MGLKEERFFKNHIQLDPISETREAYISGNLFEIGDQVVIKDKDQVAEITQLGTNYVIVEANGMKFRKWLEDVELLEKDTHKTKDGKTAKKGLWYNINQKRKRGEKPAKPGDKDYPKTLDIEQTNPVDIAKQRVQQQKAQQAKRHDSMMDRARLRDAKQKNKETK